ncbi:pyridoxal-phosphate dependent enzyme [Oceaniglobus ichthyenteri]|uniref:pyridoxal-phosphate dependent enzyme n=1 Tax=Oceaniglobus ichthyenteri TaxID=2136177 RepID=UPI000D3B1F87|nr:pyridoxal-phosphate dependent enzyme [Oceaniglobus ichthyenteri]
MIEIDLHERRITAGAPLPSRNVDAPLALLRRCPKAMQTPLVNATNLAQAARCAELWVKDERTRMGLGSFKALGAAYVIAHLAETDGVKDRVFVTASAGNHGLSVAAGAQAFGAKAVVYIADTVPEAFADRLRQWGANVVREGAVYEDSMAAAAKAADARGWTLLSDSSWPGYTDLPHRLMEGYLVMAHEAVTQAPIPPTHVFLQAGVGGMAAAVAAHMREIWGDSVCIVVVEPDRAPSLRNGVRAGAVVAAPGPESNMGRLDCKEASLIALAGLTEDADAFLTISDQAVAAVLPHLAEAGLATSPSGGAGLAAVLSLTDEHRQTLGLGSQSRVMCILSEGPA